jgi:3-hydroxybutyryl-CoA dehydrogenase
MGVGVTQSLIQHGCSVTLVDVGSEKLQRAQIELTREARMSRLLGPGSSGESPGHVTLTADYDALSEVEFVVENTTENWEVKSRVYPLMDRFCVPECVFAANTSAVSITRLAALTGRPDRVLGMHFMNPVPLKNTVEVIRGWHTSDATLGIGLTLLAVMGKEGIVVKDHPGFVSNRVLMLTVNEAIYLLQDGVANATDVDRIFRSCFGHKMGPLETADLIGLDTILYSIEMLHESFNDSKYRPCPLLRKMVDAGLHGRKSGQGFFSYN